MTMYRDRKDVVGPQLCEPRLHTRVDYRDFVVQDQRFIRPRRWICWSPMAQRPRACSVGRRGRLRRARRDDGGR